MFLYLKTKILKAVSYTIFTIGHLISVLILVNIPDTEDDEFEGLAHRAYQLYNWLMITSGTIQDVYGEGPWTNVVDNMKDNYNEESES